MGDTVYQKRTLTGRRVIKTSVTEITRANVMDVLAKAMSTHNLNSGEIDYLWKYYKGEQPIMHRVKDIRPEICNRIVENRANEIVSFKVGYNVGEPIQYVGRGNDQKVNDMVSILNEMMYEEDKHEKDQEIVEWHMICGTAYRMILPDSGESDFSPFEIYTLDPRETFVVYSNDVGNKPIMAVKYCKDNDTMITTYSVYTENHYWLIKDSVVIEDRPHALGMIPIIEYPANRARLGCFEIVLPLLDQLNDLESNRMDGVEQFVQSFFKFINCDISMEDFEQLRQMGAIKIKSLDSNNHADVDIITSELDQSQVQTLKDDVYSAVLTICGMPNRNGGTSTSDTGNAVLLRDGWAAAESRAKDWEHMFKQAERQMLRLVLRICRDTSNGVDIEARQVDIKFTRRQTDNLLTKCQALTQMLSAGINPVHAISTCGLWSDPLEVAYASADTLRKWDYRDPLEGVDDIDVEVGDTN